MKPEAAKTLVDRQATSLVQEHNDGCPWKNKQCDPSLYSIPLSSPTQLLGEIMHSAALLTPLLERVHITHPLSPETAESLGGISKAFREKEQRKIIRLREREQDQARLEDPNQQTTAIAANPDENAGEDSSALVTAISVAALTVALFGWKPIAASPTIRPPLGRAGSTFSRAGSIGMSPIHSRAATPAPDGASSRLTLNRNPSQVSLMDIDTDSSSQRLVPEKTMLRCEMCFRRVPLWGLLEPTNSPAMDSSTPSSSSKPSKSFDVVKEHRHTCAYITKSSMLPSLRTPSNTDSRESSDLLTGWEARLSAVLRFGIGDAARLERFGIRPTVSRGDSNSDFGSAAGRNGTKEVLSYLRRLLG